MKEQNTQVKDNTNHEQAEKDVKLNKQLKSAIAIVVILIVLIALAGAGLFAYAKYRQSSSGTASAQIAKWYFDLKDGNQNSVSSGNANFAITRTDGRTHVAEGKLAPGTYGEFEMYIDTRGTETDLTYEIVMELTNCPTYLKFYRDEQRTVELPKVTGAQPNKQTITLKKYLQHDDAYIYNQPVTIYWEWPYESGGHDADLQDSLDVQNDMTINITATATEVMGTPTGTVDYLDLGANYKLEVETGETATVNINTASAGFSTFENINYTSDNTSIATVDTTNGVQVTGVAEGSTTITLTGATSGETQKIYVTVVTPTYEITLDSQSATTAGTAVIYEKYGVKFSQARDGEAMTTSAYNIIVPTKTHNVFQGYYTGTNGSGTQYIDANGYLTSSASNTNFSADGTLYAYWIPQYAITFDASTNGGEISGENSVTVYVTQGSALSTVLASLPSATKSGNPCTGWFTSASGGTEVTTATVPSGDDTYYAQYELSVNLGNGIVVTKDNVKNYLGKAVSYTDNDANTSLTYRLFYVDFDNKYGDGAGTVYLMADYDSSLTRTLSNFSNNYSSSNASDSTMKINQMNPLWAKTRGGSSVTWNANEQSAAYLCDTTQWSAYANSDANYAIGGASTEMYIDSYNLSGIDTEVFGYEYQTTNTPGYVYTINGVKQNSGWYTNSNTLESNKMYTNNDYNYWWLASPSANDANRVCYVNDGYRRLNHGSYANSYWVHPLVSLKSGVTVNFTE